MEKYILWGAGIIGKSVVDYAKKKNITIECIVDSDTTKAGQCIENIMIVSPSKSVINNENKIIIAVGKKYYDEVRTNILNFGVKEENIIKVTDFKKIDTSGSDMSFAAIAGYIEHDRNYVLQKSAQKNKIFIDKNSMRNWLYVEDKEEFQHILKELVSINSRKTYTADIKTDNSNEYFYYQNHLELYSYAIEWPPEMYRDMCIFLAEFMFECNNYNLSFNKLSYFDVVFYQGSFLYKNIFNIRQGKLSLRLIRMFAEKFLSVLLLMSVKKYDRAEMYISCDYEDFGLSDIKGFLSSEQIEEFNTLLMNIEDEYKNDNYVNIRNMLIAYIKNINLNLRDVFQWDGYQSTAFANMDNEEKWGDKQRVVISMLKDTDAKTMMDIAGNMGWYCVAMKNYMKHTIVADIDYNSIDYAYTYIRQNKINNVYPIHLNFISPPLEYYKNKVIGKSAISPWIEGAVSRFKSDVIVALALIHHLSFSQQLSFEEIVNQMAAYTKKWLLIEYVERNDDYVQPFLINNTQFDWYNKTNFLNALQERFYIENMQKTSNTRILYLCRLKSKLK